MDEHSEKLEVLNKEWKISENFWPLLFCALLTKVEIHSECFLPPGGIIFELIPNLTA